MILLVRLPKRSAWIVFTVVSRSSRYPGSGYTDVTENHEKARVDNVSKSFVCINSTAMPTLSPSFELLNLPRYKCRNIRDLVK